MDHSPGFLRLAKAAKSRIRETSCEVIRQRQLRGERFLFIDVREDHEWQQGHAAGAVHLGRGIIERDIERIVPDHGTDIVLYCGGGFRSAMSADMLQQMGYSNVVSMDGGWKRWTDLNYPAEVG
jgi:rhodanese-related sulfurtransferase